ncbi:MAG: zinc-binding dehydrogenase [Solirubrobacteraceae bacterium]
MRTIEVTRFGGPEVPKLRDRPDPVAGPGQVVVDVAAIPLLWLDTALRSGKGRDWFPVKPPYVPCNGVAGTVSSTGPGVDDDWIGRDVVTDTRQTGSYTDRVAVPADGLLPIPQALTALAAAALLTDGRTALGILDGITVQAGTPVLITGAAGGMGLLLVQLATAGGAHVVGAACGEPKLAAVRAQGAGAAIDYSAPDWTDHVPAALGGDAPAVVLDGVGGGIGRAALPSPPTAACSPPTAPPRATSRRSTRTPHASAASPSAGSPTCSSRPRRAPADCATCSRRRPPAESHRSSGRQTYPLQDAAEAHRRIEAREVIGKSLLLVNQSGASETRFRLSGERWFADAVTGSRQAPSASPKRSLVHGDREAKAKSAQQTEARGSRSGQHERSGSALTASRSSDQGGSPSSSSGAARGHRRGSSGAVMWAYHSGKMAGRPAGRGGGGA